MSAFSGCRWIAQRPSVAVIALALVLAGGPAEAGNVKDLYRNLYGGDGITIPTQFHEAHFTSAGLEELDDISDDVTDATAFQPFNSSATSIRYNIIKGEPERIEDTLGPLLAERATTIGRGRLDIGASFTHIPYARFGGDKLSDLSVSAAHEDCCTPDPNAPGGIGIEPDGVLGPIGTSTEFELDKTVINLDTELVQNIFAAFATLGITDRWDVGAVVPIIHIDGKVKSEYATFDMNGNPSTIHQPETDPNDPDFFQDSNREDSTGLGDIRLRTKYNFATENKWGAWTPDSAVTGQIRLPTGKENDLRGTGDAGFLGLAILSKDFRIPTTGNAPAILLTPHINVGYEVFTGSTTNNLLYAFSNETSAIGYEWITGVTEIVGRAEPNGDGTNNVVDFSFGGKVDVLRMLGRAAGPVGGIVLTANFLIPINRDTGLRADFAWGAGAQAALTW